MEGAGGREDVDHDERSLRSGAAAVEVQRDRLLDSVGLHDPICDGVRSELASVSRSLADDGNRVGAGSALLGFVGISSQGTNPDASGRTVRAVPAP